MENGSLMQLDSIAECSRLWSIRQYFWPAVSDNRSWTFFSYFERLLKTEFYCSCIVYENTPFSRKGYQLTWLITGNIWWDYWSDIKIAHQYQLFGFRKCSDQLPCFVPPLWGVIPDAIKFQKKFNWNKYREWIEPVSSMRYTFAGAYIEDSDQPAHPRSLIRVFDRRSMSSQGSNVSSGGKPRFWSDCAYFQTYFNLRCT